MDKLSITPAQIKQLHVLYRNVGLDEDEKKDMLLLYTGGRTRSSKGLTCNEAQRLIEELKTRCQTRDQIDDIKLRKKRSGALKRMQQIGIDTTDWAKINGFCRDKRIAGKDFFYLNQDELSFLIRKLEEIKSK